MKYSLIMPCYNQLRFTIDAINSIFNNSNDSFELILINNGSIDGTKDYFTHLFKTYANIEIINNSTNRGFCSAINQGTKISQGKYIVWVNNDILATPNWLEQLSTAIETFPKITGLPRVGLAGPVSNFVAGRQSLGSHDYNPNYLDNFSVSFHKENQENYHLTGFLSGFCLMIKRQIINEIGLVDEKFNPGGFEDNDYLLRAEQNGWRGIIAADTFVHHCGSVTLNTPEFKHMLGGISNRHKFYDKWQITRPQKLVAAYRVKDCANILQKSLVSTSKFADEIVIFDDNSTDDTVQVAKSFKKVVHVEEKKDKFDELKDRRELLLIAKSRNPDWIIIIDGDEILEDKFTRTHIEKLMHPTNPHTKSYGMHWYTYFLGETHWRTDGTFGNMRGCRLFKNEPHQFIAEGGFKGLHCGTIPPFPPENVQWTNTRIKHYGYSSPEECKRKFFFYSNLDTDKIPMLIGQTDYSHLTENQISLSKWHENISCSLILCYNGENIETEELLNKVEHLVDQIVFVDTTKEKSGKDIANRHNCNYHSFKWTDNFSKLRNFAKYRATGDWILHLDPDELLEDAFIEMFPRLLDTNSDCYLVTIHNYHKDGPETISDSIRLFRNIPELKYEGRIHENLDNSTKKLKLKIIQCPYKIHHYGYLVDSKPLKAKLALYKKLNELEIKEHPKDAKAHFNLALHYLNDGLADQAATLFNKAAQLDKIYYHPRLQLGVIHLRAGKAWLEDAIKLLPSFHRLYPDLSQTLATLENIVGPEEIKLE